MKTSIFLSLLFATAFAAGSPSAGPVADAGPLPVTPALINALAGEMRTNGPSLKAAAARAQAARANTAAVRVWEDPMVEVGGMFADSTMRAEEGDLLYGMQQKLPLFGKSRLARQMATAAALTEEAGADYQFQGLRRDLARALFRLALAGEELAAGQEDLGWLDGMLAVTEQRYRLGSVSQAQLFRMQNERAVRATQLQTEEQRRRQAAAAVNRLLARPTGSPFSQLTLPPPAGPVPYDERLVQFAISFEPRLKLLRLKVKEGEASVAQTRRQRYPDVSVGAEARNSTASGDFRQAMLTVAVSVPWLNASKYRRDVDRQSHQLQAAVWDAADYELGLREEVQRLCVLIDAARREAQLYRDEIGPRSEAALRSAEAAWRANEGTLYDVLESARMRVEARRSGARALAEQWTELSELVLCCGLGDLEALAMIGADPALPSPSPSQP